MFFMKINLVSTQPAHPPTDLIGVFRSQQRAPEKYTLQQVGEMTQGLFDAFTHEDISRYEKNPAIVKLHEQLVSATGADRLRLSMELKNAKAREYIERSNFMSMVHDFQGVCGAVAAFSNPEIANKISVISSHLVNIGVQIAGLAGCGPLAAEGAVTPIGFGSAILTAVGHISHLFQPRKGIAIEQATLDAICVLSQQIHQLHEEVVRRFDDLNLKLTKLEIDIVQQFALLHKKADHLQEGLELIHEKMVRHNFQIQHTLSSLSQAISDLGHQFTDQATRTTVDKISSSINAIKYDVTGGYMDDTRFAQVISQVLADIDETSKLREVAGPLTVLSPKEVAKWQPTRGSALWANYYINPMQVYVAKVLGIKPVGVVSNPLLLCYSTLALLLINSKRYTTSEDRFALHISKRELTAIKKVAEEVNAVQLALVPLRNLDIYVFIFQQIQLNLVHFEMHYQAAIEKFQKMKTQEIELAAKQARIEQQALEIKRFNMQTIEPDSSPPLSFRAHRKVVSGGIEGDRPDEGVKVAYVKAIDNIVLYNKKYQELEARVIYPAEGYLGPLLPITPALIEDITKKLPKNIQDAIEFNVIALTFRYFTRDNCEFHLQVWTGDKICYEVNLPYQMPMYKPNESEWLFWVGGCTPTGKSETVGVSKGSFKHKRTTFDFDNNIVRPILEQRKGYIECFNPEEHVNIVPIPDLKLLDTRAGQLLEEIYQELREQFNRSIHYLFDADTNSPLGVAITEFDALFKQLKAVFALAFPDAYSSSGDLSRLIHELDIPTSRSEFLLYLQANPTQLGSELFNKIRGLIALYQELLPSILEHLKTTTANQSLETVAAAVDTFIQEYEPTAVETNPVVPVSEGSERHDTLRASQLRVKQLEALLGVVARRVRDLPPEVATQIVDGAAEDYRTFLQLHPHLIGLGAVEASSVAQLMARSDSPIFGARGGDLTTPAAKAADPETANLDFVS